MKKIWPWLAALLLLLGEGWVRTQQHNPDQLYEPLLQHLSQQYDLENPVLEPLPPDTAVPLYQASAWQRLSLPQGQEIWIYFDESNRADYLAQQAPGLTPFGLRFVLYQP